MTSERVVNQILTELDGLEDRKQVYVIAATNRPDIIDRAMLRPGRFDKLVYVKLPTPDERVDILRTLLREIPVCKVNPETVAFDSRCDRFSGADLSALVKEAGMMALREQLDLSEDERKSNVFIQAKHFDIALSRVTPSVTEKDLRDYDRISSKLE